MSDRDDAIAFLRTVMDNPDAKPQDRIKAAEAIVRADEGPAGKDSELHDMNDAELLARARGEASPPPSAVNAPALEAAARLTTGHGLSALGDPGYRRPGPDHHVPRETPLAARRGPKTDPAPAGGPKLKSANPKKGPKGTQNGPVVSTPIASPKPKGQYPNPWE